MSNIWIVLAESSRAKLLSVENRRGPITEIEDLTRPEGRLHEGDLVSDTPGSDGGSIGQGRHVVDSHSSAKQHEARYFARTLAQRLDEARSHDEFRKLVLVAPPSFLGLLRSTLSKEVLAMISNQVAKNLVQEPVESIRHYL